METSEGVRSAFSWLTGWNREGDYATYRINVTDPGIYEVSLKYKGTPNEARIKASSGKDSVINTIETYDLAILGSFQLSEEDKTLTLELVDNPSGLPVFDQLNTIQLLKK
jgi:hypothetical protein